MLHPTPAFDQQLPLLPEAVLRRHFVYEPSDTRFRAAARLLQALWRKEHKLPIGYHTQPSGRRRKLGSRIGHDPASAGANFLSQDIARVVARELIYREPGALMDQHRLCANLLSSMPATFNVFAPLKWTSTSLARCCATSSPGPSMKSPAFISSTPGRNNAAYTGDHTAFDVLIRGFTEDRRRSFIAIEVKYSETMWEPVPAISPRVMELGRSSGLYRDPDQPTFLSTRCSSSSASTCSPHRSSGRAGTRTACSWSSRRR